MRVLKVSTKNFFTMLINNYRNCSVAKNATIPHFPRYAHSPCMKRHIYNYTIYLHTTSKIIQPLYQTLHENIILRHDGTCMNGSKDVFQHRENVGNCLQMSILSCTNKSLQSIQHWQLWTMFNHNIGKFGVCSQKTWSHSAHCLVLR